MLIYIINDTILNMIFQIIILLFLKSYYESIIMRNNLFENTVNADNFENAEEAVPEYI